MEAFKTNVLGTENLINSAISNEVEKVICLSTDKAVLSNKCHGNLQGYDGKGSYS